MSQSATYEYSPQNDQNGPSGAPRQNRRSKWRPLEIAAVVLGFVVWWPVGLALLMWKLWRSKNGHNADIIVAARNLEETVMTKWPEKARRWGCSARREDKADWSATTWGGVSRTAANWGFTSAGVRATGNSAFDDWRDAELARLEEERRKLEAAEREFSSFIDDLRRARDREEFEQYMRARTASQNGPAAPGAPDQAKS